jgi:hypothetical protein
VGTCLVHTAARKRDFQLWIPLPLVCLMLIPLGALLLPVLAVSCALARVSFYRTLGTVLDLLWSLRGTHLEVALNHYSFLVHIA